MPENHLAEQPPRRTLGQMVKQAGLFILFGTLLTIPRIRRLRRQVWVWSLVRLAVAAGATWLGWRYKNAGAGVSSLVVSLLLFAFSLLVRAKPAEKSADATASELNALIVLNGGTFRVSPDSIPVPRAQIFVHPERIIVQGHGERRLLDIPLARVQDITACPAAKTNDVRVPWEVKIVWQEDAPCTATFEYDGTFAEHLARVTESTLRSQWKKGLPVIQLPG